MLEGEFWNGSDTIVSSCQVSVFHTLTVLSSDYHVSVWNLHQTGGPYLGSQEVAHWIPGDAFDKSLMASDPVYAFYVVQCHLLYAYRYVLTECVSVPDPDTVV